MSQRGELRDLKEKVAHGEELIEQLSAKLKTAHEESSRLTRELSKMTAARDALGVELSRGEGVLEAALSNLPDDELSGLTLDVRKLIRTAIKSTTVVVPIRRTSVCGVCGHRVG